MGIVGTFIVSITKSLFRGGIGAVVGVALAEALGWNVWVLGIIGYILGYFLLSKDFWEGMQEAADELEEEEKAAEEERKKKEKKKKRKKQ